MPSIGGLALGEQMRAGLAGLRNDLDALRLDAAAAVTELFTEVRNGQEGVKRHPRRGSGGQIGLRGNPRQ